MGVIDLRDQGREPASGKRWEAYWWDVTGSRRTKRFRTLKEARDHEAAMRMEKDRLKGGSVDERRAKQTTVSDLHRQHIESIERDGGRGRDGGRASTLAGYESQYRNWIDPGLGTVKLSDLSRELVEQWRTTMVNQDGKTPSERTRATVIAQLSRLLTFAVDEGLLRENPSKTRSGRLVGKPKTKKSKQHIYLDEPQVWRLLAHAKYQDEETHDVVLLMVTTGIRFGELSALTADDFDPDTGDLHITKAYSSAHGRLILERTKGGEDRIVRVNGWIRDRIADCALSRSSGELLFSGAQGAPLRLDNWRPRKFYPVVEAARTQVQQVQEELGVREYKRGYAWWGPKTQAAWEAQSEAIEREVEEAGASAIAHAPRSSERKPVKLNLSVLTLAVESVVSQGSLDFPRLTPHDLRHTAVSVAIRKGADVKAVQAIAGHASAAITLDVYAGLFDEARDQVANTLQDAFANPYWAAEKTSEKQLSRR